MSGPINTIGPLACARKYIVQFKLDERVALVGKKADVVQNTV